MSRVWVLTPQIWDLGRGSGTHPSPHPRYGIQWDTVSKWAVHTHSTGMLPFFTNIYHLQTKYGEGNVFSGICLGGVR